MNLKEMRDELIKRCKAGPSSDYQDLWITINSMLKEFETELRVKLASLEIKAETLPLTKEEEISALAQIQLLSEILGDEVFRDLQLCISEQHKAHSEVLDLLTRAWLRSMDSGDYYLIGEELEKLILKLEPPYLPCIRCGRKMSWLRYHARQGMCMKCAKEVSKEANEECQ